jgi:serine/threonine-protein kinase
MSASDDAPLLSAAEKISSGVRVDWNELQDQVATPDQAAVAEELRTIERVAQISGHAPTVWGRFQIVAEIGRGTFGTVYCAYDPILQLEVALKVIRAGIPGLPFDPDRALEEARRLVRLKHDNVVRAYGAELIEEEVGLSMELVKGKTLDEIVKQQAPFSANEAAVIGVDLCRALAAVHRAEILHGDIKAHNVMREAGGRVVLMDFGTGRSLKRQRPAFGNDIAGTPLYLAPEVFAGHPRTPSSEIYSLGVLLYFLVTGSYPVEGDTRTEVRKKHDRPEPRRPLRDVRPDLPEAFIRIVERATASDPGQRYPSAGHFEAALSNFLSGGLSQPEPEPAWTWKQLVPIAATIAIVVGLAAFTVQRIQTRATGRLAATSLTAERGTAAAGPAEPSTAAPVDYRIESVFYRESNGAIERLKPGAQLKPGDALSLQVQTSIPMHFYVINEDERGESYLLFPLPGQTQNPLPPGRRHRLPASQDGELISWQVTSSGLREHFLIVASPEGSTSFDELFATLPQPVLGKPTYNARLSSEAVGVLRSVGGLTPSPLKVDRQLRMMPEFSTPLTEGEESGSGVWIRHATFVNPDK